MLDTLALQAPSRSITFILMIYSVFLSFILSTLIAVVYDKTYRGLSYSRNFIQALILSAIVAGTVMQAIGDSLARGLGMLGALAIIRFRTNLKDPRDIIFMFAGLATGIACGVNAYIIAVIGALGFCAVAALLYHSPFGQTSYFDGMLRFNMENDPQSKRMLEKTLNDHCRLFALITLRDMAQGTRLDYAYHVKLRKGREKAEFMAELGKIASVRGLALLLQETTVEL